MERARRREGERAGRGRVLSCSVMSRLFVSQELLDQWAGEGKVEIEGNTLKLTAEKLSFDVQPGVRFLKLAAGEDREHLIGRVKSESQMNSLGAELYMSSVLVGEDAYDVQSGFLCEVPTGAAKAIGAAKSQLPAPAGVTAPKTAEERSALAQFLLENLS
jgi:hypothetical protein